MRTVLEDALEQACDNQAVQRRSGLERISVRDTEPRVGLQSMTYSEPVWPST